MGRLISVPLLISLAGTFLFSSATLATAEEVPQLIAAPSVKVPEVVNDLAISNSGIVLASFQDAEQVGIIALDGSLRRVDVGCRPTDVTIMPDAQFGALVCQDSSSLLVVDLASAAVFSADLNLERPIRVTYLPKRERIVTFGALGQIVLLSARSLNDYEVLKSFEIDLYTEAMTVSKDERFGYVPGPGGKILRVEFETGVQTLSPRGDPSSALVTLTSAEQGEFLYGVGVEQVGERYQTFVTRIDPNEGTQSNRVDLVNRDFVYGQTAIVANNRVLFVANGVGAEFESRLHGFFGIGIDSASVLGSFIPLISETYFAGVMTKSADGTQLAVGNTIEEVLRYSTANVPYRMPVAPTVAEEKTPTGLVMTVSSFSKKGNLVVKGKATGYGEGSKLTIFLKELGKKPQSSFRAQKVEAIIDINGDFTWRGKSKAMRVSLYALSPADNVKSNVVIAARR